MADYVVAPECPCGNRTTKLRFDPERHIGAVRCDECEEVLMVVSVLSNRRLTVVRDPMAGPIPEETYEQLREHGRLPAAADMEADDD